MDKKLLQKMIDERFVSKTKHPSSDIFIYNYTAKTQYDWVWNEVTKQCRGLIMDGDNNIIAKPFEKFFSIEQLERTEETIPNQPFEVFEKLDGSLGVLYWINETPFIATRGSFISEQAKKATEILHSKYKHIWKNLDKNKTYLFEIIYPDNRIVVDYGLVEDIFLLTTIDLHTKQESLPKIGFPVIQKYDGINDLDILKTKEKPNNEGFVVRFENNFRLKVKFEEYKRLHRIVTQVSNVIIWEYLKEKRPFDELFERVPDEFYNWLTSTKNGLVSNYEAIEANCKSDYKELGTRKDTALYFQTKSYPHILFAMLDNKDYAEMIWKAIKPKWTQPFRSEV